MYHTIWVVAEWEDVEGSFSVHRRGLYVRVCGTVVGPSPSPNGETLGPTEMPEQKAKWREGGCMCKHSVDRIASTWRNWWFHMEIYLLPGFLVSANSIPQIGQKRILMQRICRKQFDFVPITGIWWNIFLLQELRNTVYFLQQTGHDANPKQAFISSTSTDLINHHQSQSTTKEVNDDWASKKKGV